MFVLFVGVFLFVLVCALLKSEWLFELFYTLIFLSIDVQVYSIMLSFHIYLLSFLLSFMYSIKCHYILFASL